MKKPSPQLIRFILTVLVLLSVRITYYEPWDRSVSNFDTQEFVTAAHIPFFSSDFFTSGRPATIALIYKLAEPLGGYAITNISSPGDFLSPSLTVQPGLGNIVAVQQIISIAAWVALASVSYRNLKHPLPKFLGPLLILLFGFAPQTAEWDFVLMSEPVSLSLFVILLALSIELVSRLALVQKSLDKMSRLVLIGWISVALVWVFARDTNVYLLLAFMGAFGLALLVHKKVNLLVPARLLLICLIFLVTVFLVQNRTAQLSGRWVNPYFNNLLAYVFSDPEHLAFFEQRGLPLTAEVLALRGSSFSQSKFFEISYLINWVKEKGISTYIVFIATHPDWAMSTVSTATLISFDENAQPFFTRNDEVTPNWFLYLGDLFHPTSTSVFFVVTVEFLLLIFLAFRTAKSRATASLFVVFFAGEILMLFVSIIGDASSIVRHTIVSLQPLRLSIWLLLPFIFDLILLPTLPGGKTRHDASVI